MAGFLALELDLADDRRWVASLAGTAGVLAMAGAEVLVLAAADGGTGYDRRQRPGPAEWRRLASGLAAAREVAETEGLALAVHPHVGTPVEGGEDVSRLLELTDADLCLDIGTPTEVESLLASSLSLLRGGPGRGSQPRGGAP